MARRSLILSRVVELGVRRGVHHLVARREIRSLVLQVARIVPVIGRIVIRWFLR